MKLYNEKSKLLAILIAISEISAIPGFSQSWQPVPNRPAAYNQSRARATNIPRATASSRNSKVRSSNAPSLQSRQQTQSYQNYQRNQTNQYYQANQNYQKTQQNSAARSAISHNPIPVAENSFYPISRESAPSFNSFTNTPSPMKTTQSSEWRDLGNGAIFRSVNSDAPSTPYPEVKEESSRLSPEVLETIRQLKAEYEGPEPLYQMAPASNASPNTISPKQSNGLISPTANSDIGVNKNNQSAAKDIEGSTLKLPPGRNIRIKSLDFRQTDVSDAFRSLSRIININLMLAPGVSGKQVTVLFNDVTMEEAFNTLLVNFDLAFSWEGKILRIFPITESPTSSKIFTIQHTGADEIKPMVDRLLSSNGKSEIEPRTNSIIVTDTKAKLTEIENMLPQIDVPETGLEITSRPVTEVFYLNYADAKTITEAIQMLSEKAKIKEFSSNAASQAGAADGAGATSGRMDMMIITDTMNNLDRIRELIDKLDVPPIQVTIDAHIYEINKDKSEEMGFDWQKAIPVSGTSGTNLFSASLAPMKGNYTGTGVFRFGSLDINQFSAVLSMLNNKSFAKVLSNPVITTLNNKKANISVGQEISYISAVNENGQTGNISNTVERTNASIALEVTPSVTGNDEVFLDILPSIVSVLGYSTLGGNQTPNLSTRTAKTQVICKNNHTIVIGGMIKTDKSETVDKIPVLGNLPGIGRLFQNRTIKENRTELIIFITPHIVREKRAKEKSEMLSYGY